MVHGIQQARGELIAVLNHDDAWEPAFLERLTLALEAHTEAGLAFCDHGVMHADGYIQLKDRSKDIIISGGENISSIEVEDALYKHPAVAAAAVVAKPDDKWGETPCAFVELKPGTKASADDLMQWCRKHLASYKCPRYIVFADIPKTSTGKIQKFVLRETAKAL